MTCELQCAYATSGRPTAGTWFVPTACIHSPPHNGCLLFACCRLCRPLSDRDDVHCIHVYGIDLSLSRLSEMCVIYYQSHICQHSAEHKKSE